MKMTSEQRAAEERMKPGVLTSGGFLGTDGRGLADIIEADEERFRALGLDFAAVADALDRLAEAGRRGLGEPISVEGGWVVKSDDARGMIACPYQDGLYHKNAISAESADGKHRLVYSELSVHLLRVHHFCQGTGSPFRLEPDTLSRLVGGA